MRHRNADIDAKAEAVAEQIKALFKELDALDYEVSRCSGDQCGGHRSDFGSNLAHDMAEHYHWELN